MKICLLDLQVKGKRFFTRDTAGGFGTVTRVGSSIFLKPVEWIKDRAVRLPPIMLAYLASIFKEAGHELEYRGKGIPEVDLVLILSSIIGCREELEAAEEIKRRRKVRVGFVGPFASVKSEVFVESCDFLIKGEPEEAALRIAKGEFLKGVVESKPINDLDSLPFPYWKVFPVSKYSYFPLRKPFLTMLSSRGCTESCRYYCPYPVAQGSRWRGRSAESVVREMEYLRKDYSVNSIMLRDPVFSFDRERCRDIASGILERGIKINWGFESRLDSLDMDSLELMYRAGLRHLEIGIESSSGEALKKMRRRKILSENQEKLLDYCYLKGIRVVAFFILGLPDETVEEIELTINLARRLNVYAAQFAILTPYPGTPFYQEISEKLNGFDWDEFNGYSPVFKHRHLGRSELLKLKEKAFLKFYYSPRRLARLIKGCLSK